MRNRDFDPTATGHFHFCKTPGPPGGAVGLEATPLLGLVELPRVLAAAAVALQPRLSWEFLLELGVLRQEE